MAWIAVADRPSNRRRTRFAAGFCFLARPEGLEPPAYWFEVML
jgi:hypothetical protein